MQPLFHPAAQALAGGLLIGLAAWLLLASLGRIAGVSNIAAKVVAPDAQEPCTVGFWRWGFIAGLVIGGAWAFDWFGMKLGIPASVTRSPVLLLVAGGLVGVGTVIANGCTSGHGICGLGTKSKRSLIAVLVFMAAGIATVSLMSMF